MSNTILLNALNDALVRVVQAREELAGGEDLVADSVLRDLEHDLSTFTAGSYDDEALRRDVRGQAQVVHAVRRYRGRLERDDWPRFEPPEQRAA